MTVLVSFRIRNSAGTGLTAASPTFVEYRDSTGASRTPPAAPAHLNAGHYTFLAPDADVGAQTVWLVDCGVASSPRYRFGTLCLESTLFRACLFLASSDTYAALSGAPTWGKYTNGTTGAGRTPPTLVQQGSAGLYTFVATPADAVAQTVFRVDAPSGAAPDYFEGEFNPIYNGDGVPPTVTVVSPAAGTNISAGQPITIDVTDNGGAFARVILVARYASLGGAEEVVHNGDRASLLYAATTRTAISGGFRYVVSRVGGWLADPILDVYATDATGVEA
jgi:hypothetical protein